MILLVHSDILKLGLWKGAIILKEDKICSKDFAGIYSDIADIVGIEGTKKLFSCLKGQQITFPTRLYTQEYVVKEVKRRSKQDSIGKLAVEYGYTEKWVRKLIKQEEVELD